MRCGLYGKLPAKRDFIAVSTPREFLAAWEPWLQGGISASRVKLGPAWQEAYLRAPIWRFWLGAEICGAPVLGAIMPSVDGVGRYFPLTIFVRCEPGEELAPPEIDSNDEWLSKAEELLLSALSEGTDFEALTGALESFPSARASSPSAQEGTFRRLPDGSVTAPLQGRALEETLSGIRRLDHVRLYGSATFWWTLGGEGFASQVLAARRMPDPYVFAGMLTGRFDDTL